MKMVSASCAQQETQHGSKSKRVKVKLQSTPRVRKDTKGPCEIIRMMTSRMNCWARTTEHLKQIATISIELLNIDNCMTG